MKALIIDDDPAVRRSLAAYLEDADFTVLKAKDGEEGLVLLNQEHPNIVLCDMYMPGLNGLQVLSKVHAEFPDIPIIMISGASTIADVVEALRLGAWDYLLKPIHDLAVMEHRVNRCLHQAKLIDENRTN